MPRKSDDDHLFTLPVYQESRGSTIYLPSEKELLHPGHYIPLWLATLNFRAWWEREVQPGRRMSRADWPDAISILLNRHDRQGGKFVDAAMSQDAILPAVDEVLTSLRAISEYQRINPKTGGPEVYSIDTRRLRLFYAALGSFYINRFPRSQGGS
jgi:hypothetical protein